MPPSRTSPCCSGSSARRGTANDAAPTASTPTNQRDTGGRRRSSRMRRARMIATTWRRRRKQRGQEPHHRQRQRQYRQRARRGGEIGAAEELEHAGVDRQEVGDRHAEMRSAREQQVEEAEPDGRGGDRAEGDRPVGADRRRDQPDQPHGEADRAQPVLVQMPQAPRDAGAEILPVHAPPDRRPFEWRRRMDTVSPVSCFEEDARENSTRGTTLHPGRRRSRGMTAAERLARHTISRWNSPRNAPRSMTSACCRRTSRMNAAHSQTEQARLNSVPPSYTGRCPAG